MDTENKFLVAAQGGGVLIMKFNVRLSRADALNVAAWLVALADDDDEFPKLLEAVQNT